ncbi:MAG: AMP-binding protein [Treponema sp.]|jgi:long-chain acyl-CoA synthetase|nr:AMP-binding protein [Treponema sp.]
MLEPKDYVADWPDIEYPNFIAWLEGQAAKWQNKNAIFFRSGKQKDFTIWSYGRFADECQRIARGLLAAGLSRGDRVVLWAENRPEWMAVWMGTVVAGCTIVPVDFLVSEEECANILKITRAKAFFYSERKQDFAASLEDRGIKTAAKCGVTDGAFGKDAGTQKLPAATEIPENAPASIVFTSGTTGFAKGVTLSHKGIITNVSAAVRSLRAHDWDVFINVLPLHHTYPTTCSFLAPLSVGCSTIIVEKLVGKVVIDDIHDAQGTFLIAVPLLYDKVKAAIAAGYQKLPAPVRAVLNIFRKIALDEAKQGNYEWGQKFFMFFRRKAKLESIRIMVAGGGPLNPQTADFFDSFGFNIVQGYGMSENSPLICVSTPWHKRNESVGLPVKYTDVKIVNPNEDGVGEIAVKSPSLMLGYYENPDATAEVFDPNGYLLTGDLGYRDSDGFVFINGRQKNLIVSAGGKNIYPEEIEVHFGESRVVGEILVVGRKDPDLGEHVFAVVVPNRELLAADYPGKDTDEAFIHNLVKKEIEQVNRSLPSYKKIVDFTLRKEPFEMNAQQKIRRFLYKNYAEPGVSG